MPNCNDCTCTNIRFHDNWYSFNLPQSMDLARHRNPNINPRIRHIIGPETSRPAEVFVFPRRGDIYTSEPTVFHNRNSSLSPKRILTLASNNYDERRGANKRA